MTTKFPSLEVVSKEGTSHSELNASAHERRRLPRLNLAGEQFRHSRLGKIFSVSDLSNEGMALRILETEDFQHFSVGIHFDGMLNLHGEKYRLKGVVRHLAPELVGCQFDDLDETTRKAITKFLDPTVLGQELKPIPAPEMGTIWYRGPSGTSLFLWRHSDGQFHRMALFVLGSYIQWGEEEGLTTGKARSAEEADEVRGIMRFETLLLEPDKTPDPGKLIIARALLTSSPLPQDLKKWCVRHFE